MDRNTLLLSIKQEYAEAIMDGRKTYELRRMRPGVQTGDRVLLYVTAPTSSLCGYFRVGEVITGSPTLIWNRVQSEAGVTRRRAYDYLRNARTPCAIEVQSVERLKEVIHLDDIMSAWSDFRPPQSYRYVPKEVMYKLGAQLAVNEVKYVDAVCIQRNPTPIPVIYT